MSVARPEYLQSGLGVLLIVIPMIVALVLLGVLWGWWSLRRFERRLALERQLREMERAIREEGLPDEERERRQRYRAEQAAITREARRRLGLPEEDGDEGLT